MRDITREMIKLFKIKQLGYDFMGYQFKNQNQLSFHHLIVPHRECKQMGLGEGYLFWNGAILVQSTSHEYLHAIERTNEEMFYDITSEMIDENFLKQIRLENLKRIRDILLQFEREHCSDTTKSGKHLIKPEYVNTRIKLD